MRKHRHRPRTLASALAVASLLAGALLAVGKVGASGHERRNPSGQLVPVTQDP